MYMVGVGLNLSYFSDQKLYTLWKQICSEKQIVDILNLWNARRYIDLPSHHEAV